MQVTKTQLQSNLDIKENLTALLKYNLHALRFTYLTYIYDAVVLHRQGSFSSSRHKEIPFFTAIPPLTLIPPSPEQSPTYFPYLEFA